MGKVYIRGDMSNEEALGISFQNDEYVVVFGRCSKEPLAFFSMYLTPDEADRFADELRARAAWVREFLKL